MQEIVPREDITIIGLGRNSIGVVGETIVDMDIGTMCFKVLCVICSEQISLEAQGLLGSDFLQKYSAQIDFSKDKVILQKDTRRRMENGNKDETIIEG